MRDLHEKKTRPAVAVQNRLKKRPKTRKPINYRGFLKKTVKLLGGITLISAIWRLAATTLPGRGRDHLPEAGAH